MKGAPASRFFWRSAPVFAPFNPARGQEFVFEGVTEEPVPSILRGFSAPVRGSVSHGGRQKDKKCPLSGQEGS